MQLYSEDMYDELEDENNIEQDSNESEKEDEEYQKNMVCATKRKADDGYKNNDINLPKGKKTHKSLKDNPRPIVTPALRKKKENQIKDKEEATVSTPKQLHPSIMAQPKNTKEKEIEKDIRDMERSSPVQDTQMLETNEPIEIDDNNEANNTQTNADTSSSPII